MAKPKFKIGDVVCDREYPDSPWRAVIELVTAFKRDLEKLLKS